MRVTNGVWLVEYFQASFIRRETKYRQSGGENTSFAAKSIWGKTLVKSQQLSQKNGIDGEKRFRQGWGQYYKTLFAVFYLVSWAVHQIEELLKIFFQSNAQGYSIRL